MGGVPKNVDNSYLNPSVNNLQKNNLEDQHLQYIYQIYNLQQFSSKSSILKFIKCTLLAVAP